MTVLTSHNFTILQMINNTTATEENNTDDLLEILKEESESVVQWFRENKIIVIPDKFQAIVMQKGKKSKNTNNKLSIENITINTKKSVDLLGVALDNKLNLDEYISVLSLNAAISRLQK